MNKAKPTIVVKGSMDDDVGDQPAEKVEPQPPPFHPIRGLLVRALPHLEKYAVSGRGARCPECHWILEHDPACVLANLIAEIRKETG